jgi:hypothetical protein
MKQTFDRAGQSRRAGRDLRSGTPAATLRVPGDPRRAMEVQLASFSRICVAWRWPHRAILNIRQAKLASFSRKRRAEVDVFAPVGTPCTSVKVNWLRFRTFCVPRQQSAAGEVSLMMVQGLGPPIPIVANHHLDLSVESLPTRIVRPSVLKKRGTGVQTVGHHRVHAEGRRGPGSCGFYPARSLGSRSLPVADSPRSTGCHSIHCCVFRMSLPRPAKSGPGSRPALCE